MTHGDHAEAAVISESDVGRRRRKGSGFLRYIPGFIYILVLYVIGQLIFPDPRTTLFDIAGYKLAWVEVLMVAAAIVAMAEQMKVSNPGVNNLTEVLLMGAIAVTQIVLFALAAAGVKPLAMFNNTEFLLLTIINLAQTIVAFKINAATLVRTISAD